MATAGSIVVDLLMRTGSFETDSKRAEKRLREMQKTAKQAGAVIGTALVAVGTGLTVMVKAAIDSADAMRDLSIRVGVSTETLSAYGYAASQTGTDIDTLAKGLKVLAKNAADSLNPTSEQAKVFEALGIEVRDAHGQLKDLGDLLPEIADKFKGMEDGTTKAALAQALFGKAGLELTEFLNQGADGLADFTDKAKSLGIVIDDQTAAAADNFNDTLGDLKAVSQGYALHLAQELLPDLQDLASGFTNTATEGNKVKDMAEGTAEFLRGLATVAHIVSSAFEVLGTGLATVAAQGLAVSKILRGNFAEGMALYREASAGFNRELDEALGRNQKQPGQFSNVVGRSSTVSGTPVDTAAIARALSNPTATKGSRGSGKSQAQRDAEQLQEAYERLVESQKEQIALFGQTTEAAQVRYDTESGDLKNLTQAKKDDLIAGAERLDQLKLEQTLQEAADEEVRRATDAYQQHQDAIKDQINAMQGELSLIGLSNKEREREIALRYAGADATDAQRAAIADLSDALYDANQQAAFMDDLKDSLADMFVDFVSGAKSAKEAFGDFADYLFQRSLQMVADNLLDGLFSSSNSSGGGGGGLLSGILGLFTGGGFGGEGSPLAAGGPTIPGMYHQVGEFNRPEMYYEGGKQYLIPGDRGRVVPMGGGGGTFNYSPTFLLPRRIDNRSQQQISQRTGEAAQEAIRRNRG